MRMGVVADDITGSNDIGIMFANSGCLAYVYTYDSPGAYARVSARPWVQSQREPDICILDTNTRLAPARIAYEKVLAATHELKSAGCQQFFNKTCSVFRGNIGVEFDAMLDALGQEFAIVVLGFPKNGRISRESIHYVHGRLLEESEFRDDPIHPMRISNLVDILQSQTRRKVAAIHWDVIDQGPEALKQHIAGMQGQASYVILDVTGQEALRTIALAVQEYPVLCGSSALAEELPAAWTQRGTFRPSALAYNGLGWRPAHPEAGVLTVAGSLMPQTARQIQHLAGQRLSIFELDSLRLFQAHEREVEIERLVQALVAELEAGRDTVLHSPNDPVRVEQTRSLGLQSGRSNTETAQLVSGTLAEVAARTLERTGQDRLVVAGGETSAAVCDRLGVDGLRVWKEIQPGLPSCLTLAPHPMLLVLKSGSFGSPEFLEQAIRHLKEEVES